LVVVAVVICDPLPVLIAHGRSLTVVGRPRGARRWQLPDDLRIQGRGDLGDLSREYMVVDEMEEDSGTTVVTVVRSVAAADAVAAYYDCRDEVAATRHMDGADTVEISDDITDAYEAALASDDWHFAPLALDNRQLGKLTAGGHAYQPQQKNASRFEASTQPEPEL